MTPAPEPLFHIYLKIRPEKISWFKFLMEGYDGLAVISTIDVKKGLVRLMVPRSRHKELFYLLDATCTDLTTFS